MKKLQQLMLMMLFAMILMYGEGIEANLDNVKVFLRGAELSHSADFKYNSGENEIVITGIANNIDLNSLSVKGLGKFIIKESKVVKNYLGEKRQSEMVKMLRDSIDILVYKIEELKFLEDVERAQLELILANKDLGGEKGGPSVQELKKMTEFFKSEMSKINYNILKLQKENEKVVNKKKKFEAQLQEIVAGNTKSTNDLVVTIEARQSGAGKISVTYFTYQAGWKSGYDVRVKDIKSPLQILQKGFVWQNTGIDWSNVNLTLSTGNPSYSSTIPNLYPWHLDFLEIMPQPMVSTRMEKKAGRGDNIAYDAVLAAPPEIDESESMANYTSVQDKQISSEFVTELKYNIPSDRKEHVVTLKEYELEADYKYYAAPKLSNDVFLTAILKNWGDVVLIPGKTNIFFENSFVGSSYLNPNETDKEIKLSLGRDKSITLKRELLKDFSEDTFLSSDIERKFAYKITVKNNKKSDVEVLVEDQYPLTNQEDIEIEILSTDGAEVNKNEGKLTWKLNIASNEVLEKTYSFKVRYPDDKTIQGL